ncbi:YaaR family protein [Bacillus sp. AGMB 02131]|uniref:YaaR family protein n=1 Tax=Peribacillus faecalis TaxID=2772559 RepID=A0A927CW99_9BACI|nr:YaaR family protein [Peribacillus faecalis]MBD3108947.1 YaaR family protein [Peribacillus faecalis]
MKINQELHIKLDKVTKDNRQTNSPSVRFTGVMEKHNQKMQANSLNKLLADIDQAGDRLMRSRNFRDLAKYKSLVKRFVKEAVDFGMDLNQSQSWNQYGQSRPLKTVQTIDEQLIQLTEEVVSQEKEAIDLLGRIGEIKGLLINLYT